MPQDSTPKLRMAPAETAEETARRFEREQRAAALQRESSLEHSLAPFRVGSVGYLNTVPLTRGLEEEIIYATPARLAISFVVPPKIPFCEKTLRLASRIRSLVFCAFMIAHFQKS